MIINPYAFGGGGGGGSLSSLILAKSPVFYWRHDESSGGVMVDSSGNGRDGSYSTTPVPIPNAAIYTGGGTCMLATSSTSLGFYSPTPPALNQMTIVTIYRPNSVTGIRALIDRDSGGGGGRIMQTRQNGGQYQFVRIVGSVAVYSTTATNVFSIGNTLMLSTTVDASGNVVVYKNQNVEPGSFTSGSAAAANYGGAGDLLSVGYSIGVATPANGYFSETAIFDTVLTGADIASFAAAAGL